MRHLGSRLSLALAGNATLCALSCTAVAHCLALEHTSRRLSTTMPPVFKKVKEYDPQLANKTLLGSGDVVPDSRQSQKTEYDNRQLLIELGLADESDEEAAWEVEGSNRAELKQKHAPPDGEQSGGIAAYYPSGAGSSSGKGAAKLVEQLRARLEMTMAKLQTGRLDNHAIEKVQELLFDQQHQIDLLLRGNFSLRGSMDSIRRGSNEIQFKNTRLQEELEQQHGAALKEMEGKLEKAIQQVQQLQQATRDRQQQQEATAQLSLQAANREIGQLREKVDGLQAALNSKNQALGDAQQKAELLVSQIATLSAASSKLEQERQLSEQQTIDFRQELQQLAMACSVAQQEAESRVAALQLAQHEVNDLKEQLRMADAEQHLLRAECASIRQQLEDAKAAGQQQAAASTAQAAMQAQELEAKCRELAQQLEKAKVEKRSLEGQLEHLTQQQQDALVKQEGLQQQLVTTVQAHAELQVQYQQMEESKLKLQVQNQKVEVQLAAAATAAEQQQAAAASNHQELAQQLEALQQRVRQLQSQNMLLEVQLQEAKAHASEAQQQLQGEQAALQEQLQQAKGHVKEVERQLHVASKQQHETAEKLAAQESDSQKLQWKIQTLQMEHQKLLRTTADQVKQLQDAADQAQAALASTQQHLEDRIAATQAAADKQVAAFKQKWHEEFEKRRKLHNMVTELKGNIRVLARIRPMIEKEHSSSGGAVETAVRVNDKEMVSIAGPTVREYEFDGVFGPEDGQAQVFEEVCGLVTSILDGYNVCIMAYGQTGSGKTYTIEGPAEDPGVNSRALAELFRVAADRSSDIQYAFSASVLEIYNEQIFDLLAGSRDTGDKLDIKEGPQGLFIPGLRIEPVAGLHDVTSVLQKGKQNRSTFATNMNEHSSRSHLVLTIHLKAHDMQKGTSWSSKMHLIDLAGSERVSRSGAEGERLKEAAAINKSLSALGDVVAALQQRSSHVPYRNSKLTRLLEDSLGGSSKTLMVVNCSPAPENASETKCSLEFAARARRVELGAAQRNVTTMDPGSPVAGSISSGGAGQAVRSPERFPQPSAGGANGGSAASSPRPSINRSGGDLGTPRLAAARRAAGLQQ